MPNFALISVLCVVAAWSFPLEDIGKNALVLRRNSGVQSSLVSTVYRRSSNISGLLETFFENYNGKNGSTQIELDEDRKSNEGSEGIKPRRYEDTENASSSSEEDEEESENSDEDESSEEVIDKHVNRRNYRDANSYEVSSTESTDSNKDINNIHVSKSEGINESDFETEIPGYVVDDDKTNSGNNGIEGSTDESNKKNKEDNNDDGEEKITDTNNGDEYLKPSINELSNHKAIELDRKPELGLIPPKNNERKYFFTSFLDDSQNINPHGDWRISEPSDYSHKATGHAFRFGSKFSKSRISLRGEGKWNFKNDRSDSGSAFGRRASAHHKSSNCNFESDSENRGPTTNTNVNFRKRRRAAF